MPKKKEPTEQIAVPVQLIERRIYFIRNKKVMLSPDLAELYQVETKILNQAVKRNIERFPADFMFQLSDEEFANLKSQIVTSSWGGARRANPYAFTEQGIAMLSSVLRSSRAIQVNIAIMRAFVHIRELIANNEEIARKLEALEKNTDARFKAVFEAIKKLIKATTPPLAPELPKRRIGFKSGDKK